MPKQHEHDKQWLKGRLYGLPSLHKAAIMKHYEKQPTRREANLYILQTTTAIAKVLGKDSRFYSINVEDRDHKAQAQYHARCCVKIAAASGDNLLNAYNRIIHYITGYQITPPKLSESVINHLKANTLDETELAQVVGVLKRANDEAWWKPKLRRQHNRQIETISRLLNQVNKYRGIYASNITVDNFKTQWQNNQELLENTIATNEDGFSMSLAELSKLNVSNPAIRKAELMVRIRGFEDYSKEMGYSALFLTMTTPSKYHRSFAKSGDANPNWNGATPLDAQDYLNRTFQRIRASLSRDKITPFGFRIAEPHHDGTPHWHLLLFIPTEQQQALVETFEQYCLEEDGDEHGAKQRRFKVEYIDPEKGSATGYVVKYVSKNIDGKGIDHDSYGKEAVTSAVRIKVWASCWGIRQFQQIGGVGVTQWRELRRLGKVSDPDLIGMEPIRKAADESNWSRYTELMGGVFCKRDDQLIRPLYQNKMVKAIPSQELSPLQKPSQSQSTNKEQINSGNSQSLSRDAQHHDSGIAPNANAEIPELDNQISESCDTKTTERKATPALGNAEKHPASSSNQEQQESACNPKRASDSKELKQNRYGDALMTQLKGIVYLGVEIITRVHEWTLSHTHKPNDVNLVLNIRRRYGKCCIN